MNDETETQSDEERMNEVEQKLDYGDIVRDNYEHYTVKGLVQPDGSIKCELDPEPDQERRTTYFFVQDLQYEETKNIDRPGHGSRNYFSTI